MTNVFFCGYAYQIHRELTVAQSDILRKQSKQVPQIK